MLRQCVHSWCGVVRPGVREEIIGYANAARLFVHTHVHSTCFTGVPLRVAGATNGASQ